MAINIGANAIIGLRIVPLSVPVSNDSVITVSMYGTAVKTVAVKTQLQGNETGKVLKAYQAWENRRCFLLEEKQRGSKEWGTIG